MFSYNIHTTIDLDASAAAIWRVLTDFGRFDDGKPMLRRVRVDLAPGAAVGKAFSAVSTFSGSNLSAMGGAGSITVSSSRACCCRC